MKHARSYLKSIFAEAVEQDFLLKDPTRGGVATSLNEMVIASEVAIVLDEHTIPVRPEVRGACEILGLDPLTIANEGKLLAVVAPEVAEAALTAMHAHQLGHEAAIIGTVQAEPKSMVFLRAVVCAPGPLRRRHS